MSERWSSGFSAEPAVRVAAVVVAGGSGRRMEGAGGGARKQYLEVAGRPVLHWALLAFLRHPRVAEVVVVLPPEDVDDPPAWLRELPVTRVPGGAERGDSVRHGLQALPREVERVLIHDGARPLVDAETIDRVIDGAGEGGAVAALPATDTIKEADAAGRVVRTAERATLWHAQTPQGFSRALILELHQRAAAEGVRGTDDASLCEHYGVPVRLVAGAPENIKITRPLDLVVAEALAARLLLRPAGGPGQPTGS